MLHRTGSHPMHVELNIISKLCQVILTVVTPKSQNFAEKHHIFLVKTHKQFAKNKNKEY